MNTQSTMYLLAALILFIVAASFAVGYSSVGPVSNPGVASIGFAAAGGLALIAAAIAGSRGDRPGL